MLKASIFTVSKARKNSKDVYFSDHFFYFSLCVSEQFQKVFFVCPVLDDKEINNAGGVTSIKLNKLKNVEVVSIDKKHTIFSYLIFFPIILYKDFRKYKRVVVESDVVVLRLPSPTCIIAFPLAKFYKKKIVTYYASDIKNVVLYGNKYKGYKRVVSLLMVRIIYSIYAYFVNNADAGIFLSKDLMFRHNQKNSIYTFASLVSRSSLVDRVYSPTTNSIKILFVGRLTHEKGINYAIKAVGELLKSNISCDLTICGYGPERSFLQRMTEDLNLDSNVHFIGNISSRVEIEKIYKSHDVFLLPSISEGTPKVILEAMAYGLIVVATSVGGIPEIVEDGVNGFLVDPSSSKSISKIIMDLSRDRGLCNKAIKGAFTSMQTRTIESQSKVVATFISSVF
jgi:glycosyltransferase involved in cell wall biosynthesis